MESHRRRLTVVLGIAALMSIMLAGPRATAEVTAQMRIQPVTGPPGKVVQVRAKGIPGILRCILNPDIRIDFSDANGTNTNLATIPFAVTFRTSVTIPATAPTGTGAVVAWHFVADGGTQCDRADIGSVSFDVTP